VDRGGTGEGDEGSGYFAHEPDGAAAVDEFDVVGVQDICEGARGFEVGGGFTGAGTTAAVVLLVGSWSQEEREQLKWYVQHADHRLLAC
jgi:hypothetical protein